MHACMHMPAKAHAKAPHVRAKMEQNLNLHIVSWSTGRPACMDGACTFLREVHILAVGAAPGFVPHLSSTCTTPITKTNARSVA